MNIDCNLIAAGLMEALAAAWNAGDAAAFAGCFTGDADLVDLRGLHRRTRRHIARHHHAAFETLFRGSHLRYEVRAARLVGAALLVHAQGHLDAPEATSPPSGDLVTTVLAVDHDGDWRVAAMHSSPA